MNNENPIQTGIPVAKFDFSQRIIVNREIQKLLKMKVIKIVQHHPNEFISPIFLVPKKTPGEYRMILNLKKLNESLPYHHFKMDTFESVLRLVKPGCYMASVDLQDAYYSVYIAEKDQVKLRFEHNGVLYQFRALPNGISFAPRLFTKIMKPIYASLRVRGTTISGYIDDSYLQGNTCADCQKSVNETVQLMSDVGFMINKKKSVLVPTRKLTFLGNDIDSEEMIVTLPETKVLSIVQECSDLLKKSQSSIQSVARVLGLLVSCFSAVEYGRLFYRQLEKCKTDALKNSKGDYSGSMFITDEMRYELSWWIQNLSTQKRIIDHGNPDITITTDASTLGWSGVCGSDEIGGRWTSEESEHHINYLELLAASLSVKAFCVSKEHIHVKVESDNSCTVAYISNMGGSKSVECNDLVHKLWCWCIDHSIWLSACHIPGKENIADFGSRNFNEAIEWKLNESIFDKLVAKWGHPDIDMFASRLNKQLPKYVSWKQDADAVFVDAFSSSWSEMYMYIFCPFSVIGRTLQKLRADRGDCIMILPLWPTQNWFGPFLELLIDTPYVIPVKPEVLYLPGTQKVHPLVNQLTLVACRLSSNHLKRETFLKNQPTSLWHPGNLLPENSTRYTLRSGFSSVVNNKLIQFKLL